MQQRKEKKDETGDHENAVSMTERNCAGARSTTVFNIDGEIRGGEQVT
jgi:hypothetical protein